MVSNMTLGTLKLKKEQEKKQGWIGNGRKVDTAYRQQQLCSLRVKSNITQTYFNLLLDLAPINTWSISAFFVWIVFFIAVASWKKKQLVRKFQSDDDSNFLYWVENYNLLWLKMYGSEITLLCLQAIDKQIHVIILEHISPSGHWQYYCALEIYFSLLELLVLLLLS